MKYILIILLLFWLKPMQAQDIKQDSAQQVESCIQDSATQEMDSKIQPYFSSYVTKIVKVVRFKEPIISCWLECKWTNHSRPNIRDLHSFDVITLSTLVSTCAGVQYIQSSPNFSNLCIE